MDKSKNDKRYRKGEQNPSWKGDNVGYDGIHIWLRKTYGRASTCEFCHDTKNSQGFHWALKKGKEYERKRENFLQLCRKCHSKYDLSEKERIRLANHSAINTKKQSIPVIGLCISTWSIVEFDSINEAERTLNIHRGTISRTVKGISKHAGGYLWKINQSV